MQKRYRVLVSGRVQGVGYRESVRRIAEAEKVSGWVRNVRDGTVEALLQGEDTAAEKVVAFMRTGPRFARVDSVQVVEDDSTDELRGFEIAPTK
jgi:acylphosphatase